LLLHEKRCARPKIIYVRIKDILISSGVPPAGSGVFASGDAGGGGGKESSCSIIFSMSSMTVSHAVILTSSMEACSFASWITFATPSLMSCKSFLFAVVCMRRVFKKTGAVASESINRRRRDGFGDSCTRLVFLLIFRGGSGCFSGVDGGVVYILVSVNAIQMRLLHSPQIADEPRIRQLALWGQCTPAEYEACSDFLLHALCTVSESNSLYCKPRPAKLPGRPRPAKLPGRPRPAKLPGRPRPAKLPGRPRLAKLPGRPRLAKLPGKRPNCPVNLVRRGLSAAGQLRVHGQLRYSLRCSSATERPAAF